jgi:GNAT superfamily N-acetyltransferase
MRYLPVLHSAEEHVAFFSEHVLPVSWVVVAEVVGAEVGAGVVGRGGVVGFGAVKAGWLEHLYVVPAYQGGGVGGALLERAMGEHPGGLSLWVFEENSRAQAFYGRARFAEVERTDGSGNQEGRPDVLMRWGGVGGLR